MEDSFMSRIGTGLIFFAAACTQAAVPGNAGDDVAPDGGVADDGGAGDDGGTDPTNTLAIAPLPTTFHDERGDRITFAASGPVHDHVGATIELPGSDCPELFKYGYLLDSNPPAFGSETAKNPLRWQFRTAGAGAVDYRVRDGADTVVLDWAPLAPETADTYAVTLFRSGPRSIAQLGRSPGTFKIDVRIGDGAHQATATVCFKHHPLASPVLITEARPAHLGDAVPTWTFAANSPVSHLMSATAQPGIYEVHVLNPTAEPVSVRVAMPIPLATWAKQVVQDWVLTATQPASISCGTTSNPSTAPECTLGTPTDFPDPTTTGPLATGSWFVVAIDPQTKSPVGACTLDSATTARCDLPPRQSGAPFVDVAVLLGHHANTELKPLPVGEVGEFTLLGNTFTGLDPAATSTTVRCTNMAVVFNTRTCKSTATFRTLVALRHVSMSFGTCNISVATGLDSGRLEIPPYIPNGVLEGSPFQWDSGVDDLPGTQH
jgi:hypothetical protein